MAYTYFVLPLLACTVYRHALLHEKAARECHAACSRLSAARAIDYALQNLRSYLKTPRKEMDGYPDPGYSWHHIGDPGRFIVRSFKVDGGDEVGREIYWYIGLHTRR